MSRWQAWISGFQTNRYARSRTWCSAVNTAQTSQHVLECHVLLVTFLSTAGMTVRYGVSQRPLQPFTIRHGAKPMHRYNTVRSQRPLQPLQCQGNTPLNYGVMPKTNSTVTTRHDAKAIHLNGVMPKSAMRQDTKSP